MCISREWNGKADWLARNNVSKVHLVGNHYPCNLVSVVIFLIMKAVVVGSRGLFGKTTEIWSLPPTEVLRFNGHLSILIKMHLIAPGLLPQLTYDVTFIWRNETFQNDDNLHDTYFYLLTSHINCINYFLTSEGVQCTNNQQMTPLLADLRPIVPHYSMRI